MWLRGWVGLLRVCAPHQVDGASVITPPGLDALNATDDLVVRDTSATVTQVEPTLLGTQTPEKANNGDFLGCFHTYTLQAVMTETAGGWGAGLILA